LFLAEVAGIHLCEKDWIFQGVWGWVGRSSIVLEQDYCKKELKKIKEHTKNCVEKNIEFCFLKNGKKGWKYIYGVGGMKLLNWREVFFKWERGRGSSRGWSSWRYSSVSTKLCIATLDFRFLEHRCLDGKQCLWQLRYTYEPTNHKIQINIPYTPKIHKQLYKTITVWCWNKILILYLCAFSKLIQLFLHLMSNKRSQNKISICQIFV